MAVAQSILSQINSINYSAPITTIYKPQPGYSGFITTLRLTINLNSIDIAEFPYIPDDTPADVLQRILDEVALNTEFKEVILYLRKGDGSWIERAPIRIFNKDPYYDVNLMRFFSDANTIDVSEDLSLGIQLKFGNVLTAVDNILLWGTVVEEKKNNGNEELANRISALETLLSVFGAPSASLPGSNGLVPAPPAGSGEFLLRGDRSWENPSKFATPAQITAAINLLTETRTLTLNQALNIPANTWFTVGQFLGVALGSQETLYAITIYIQYGDGTNTYGHWQYSGGGLISCVQWKAGGAQLATTFKMEAHVENDFNCSVRFNISNFNRSLQILFDIPITTQSPSILRVKLRRLINS
jgi:hypothetical protein